MLILFWTTTTPAVSFVRRFSLRSKSMLTAKSSRGEGQRQWGVGWWVSPVSTSELSIITSTLLKISSSFNFCRVQTVSTTGQL